MMSILLLFLMDQWLIGEEHNAKPVRVLRDTGASQSLLLEGVLPYQRVHIPVAMFYYKVSSWEFSVFPSMYFT